VTEKVSNSMTVLTRAHFPFLRSGGEKLPGCISHSVRHLARADMLAMRHVLEAAVP
jgi:hypothetical protein